VRHRICGKLIVATGETERPELARVAAHAAQNGVQLLPLTAEEVRGMEPEVSCIAALQSPGTAIVDSHGFMEALLADAEQEGAVLSLRTRVRPGGRLLPNGSLAVEAEAVSEHGGEEFSIEAQEVVNCAGLAAPRVARALGMPEDAVPEPYFCKGNYFTLQGEGSKRPFSTLVYPIPEKNTSGLGVHATVDLAGHVRFGPDVEWLPPRLRGGPAVEEAAYGREDASAAYAVDAARCEAFYSAVRKYWPGLSDGTLAADYSGIRPKLSGPGMPAADFQIASHEQLPGARPSLVSLFGIESPGLTASLSLAEEVVVRLGPPPRAA